MPAGKMGKPAGGQRAGKKGSYGCKGFPTVSADGTVHGCHPTKAQAQAQARAIWASVAKKSMPAVEKAMVSEGDFVIFLNDEDEIEVGRAEYVMTEGIFGLSDSEYSIKATAEDPVLSIRCYENEDGIWEEQPYSVGVKSSEVVKIESIKVWQDSIMEMSASDNGTTGAAVSIPEEMGKGEIMTQDIWLGSGFSKRDYSPEARRRMAESGNAMPDGSYPIANRQDLMNAIRSWGRGGADPKVKAHIIRRAKELNAENMIPENWK